jgi:hypothetical protein
VPSVDPCPRAPIEGHVEESLAATDPSLSDEAVARTVAVDRVERTVDF